MNNYSENGHFHDHDRFYVPVHQSSSEWSEWSASLSAGTPMTRRLSEESAISTSSSSDLVLTPSSEYGAYDSIWPSTPAGDQYFLRSSPVSDSNDEFTPTSYNPLYRGDYIASNRSDYNTEAQDPWWNYYDFVTDLEPNQAPFWRLRPGFEPTDQFPATRAHETTYSTE
ncbi:hypothetical protein F4801DRAFT_579784 [Xylaria longipes]|nr:hypothetical protein F4801DRAFT_579784 [Xylaria longipes]